MSAEAHPALRAELDAWRQADRKIWLWLRDDDAIAPSAGLDQLAALAGRFELPVLLAVIPFLAWPGLADRLRDASLLRACQHGCWHANHAPAGGKKAEFGPHRPGDVALAEIAEGRARLDALFGERLLPVFVPPWNRIAPALALQLPALGLTGLSCFRGFTLDAKAGPVLVNTDIDIIDWHGGRVGRPAAALAAEIGARLAQARLSRPGNATLGLLLHHRDHDAGAWSALESLLGAMTAHDAIVRGDPARLFSAGFTV